MIDDLKYAFRQLRRSPGFALVAIVTLALGIGANTTIFSVVRGILLRALPYSDPDHAVMIWTHLNGKASQWVSPAEYGDYRNQTQVFSSVAIFDYGAFTIEGASQAEQVRGGLVSANLFATVGATPLLGRGFTAEEDREGGPRAVILGEGMWRRLYGGSADLLGKSIRIDAEPYTVVGVMPEAFRLPIDFATTTPSQFWVPLQLPLIDPTARGNHSYFVLGRLAAGVELPAARSALAQVVSQMKRQYPQNYIGDFDASMTSLRDEVVGRVRPALLLLLGAVGLVLLIACGNIANLLLARGESRQKELAIRAAMGASRGRMMRQLLIESGFLALIGGLAGMFVAVWGVNAIPALNPSSLPRIDAIALDVPVLTATFLLSLLTGVVFGLAPAWQLARPNVQADLKANGRSVTSTRSGRRFRAGLITAQVALAAMLVIGASLLGRSYLRLADLSPGFDTRNVLTLRLALPEASYPTRGSVIATFERTLQRMRQLPGVTIAGGVAGLPLATVRGDWGVNIKGITPPNGLPSIQADWQVIEPDYFAALGIPLKAGRYPTAQDRAGSGSVILINETFAHQFWPNASPLGGQMQISTDADTTWHTVIGVVGDIHHRGLTLPARPEMYVPMAQWFATAPESRMNVRGLTLTLKTRGDPLAIATAAREAVRAIDPTLAVSDVRTLDNVFSSSISAPRFTAVLLGLFAALALALAAVGIYGLISFVVAQRTSEMGIRVALGAETRDILRLVVSQGMRPVVIGLAAGLAASLLLARLLSAMLVGISARDLPTYAGVIVSLALVGLAACWLPARRAARVDPIVAMRND